MCKIKYGMREISDESVDTAADAIALVQRAFGAPEGCRVRVDGQYLDADTILTASVLEVVPPLAPKG